MEYKNYCPFPFEHLCIGTNSALRPCCVSYQFKQTIGSVDDLNSWWQNSDEYKELRQDFLEDKQPTQCEGCWNVESRGLESMRQKRLVNRYEIGKTKLTNLEITGGRLCNLACRMCTPICSSTIGKEKRPWDDDEVQNFIYQKSYNWLDEEENFQKVLTLFKENDIEHLYFTGGEPQLMPCYQRLLETVRTINIVKNRRIHFNTNASVFNQAFFDCVKEYKIRTIDLSIDAVGDTYDVIRYNGTWSRTKENLIKIVDYMKDHNEGYTSFFLTVVIQLANIDQAQSLQKLFDEISAITAHNKLIGWQCNLIPVTNFPEWQLHNLPPALLQNELNKLDNLSGAVIDQFKRNITSAIDHNSYTPKMFDSLKTKEAYFAQQFGKSLFHVNPEWLDYFQ